MPAVSRMFTEEEEDVAFDFELQKGEGPGGRVFTAEGEPARGAEVIVCTASMHGKIQDGKSVESTDSRRLKTDDDGRFTMLPQTDTYLLAVIHDRGYAEVKDADFLADPNIILAPWGRVEGILHVGHQRQADERVSLEYCRVYEPNLPRVWLSYNTVTDANGRFALERVAPGKVKVGHVSGSGGGMTQSHAEVVNVQAGETVEVTLGGVGQLVVGRLSMPAEYNEPVDWSRAISGVELKLAEPPRPEDFDQMIDTERRQWQNAWRESEEGKAYDRMQWEMGRFYALRIESDGTFRIEDVPAGKYQLQVTINRRPGGFWSSGSRGTFSSAAYAGTLNHEFEVPDVNEQTGEKPVDLGTLKLETKKALRVGEPAPAFRAETFDGNEIELADYSGKVVFLVFWNTETAFRAQGFEKVQQVCSRFSRNDGFVVIGLSLDADPAAARTFAKENELGWISCYPSRGMRVKVSKDYEIWGFPSTFVIGADGRILAQNPSSLLLKSVLKEALINRDSDEDLGEGLFRF
jgi:peroxiredoxin